MSATVSIIKVPDNFDFEFVCDKVIKEIQDDELIDLINVYEFSYEYITNYIKNILDSIITEDRNIGMLDKIIQRNTLEYLGDHNCIIHSDSISDWNNIIINITKLTKKMNTKE